METFYDQFFRKPVSERERIAAGTGMSIQYINKQVYSCRHQPKFSFANAVRLDKASDGDLPFTQHAEHAEEIDWAYVRSRLNRKWRNKKER